MNHEERKRCLGAAVIYGAGHWLIDGCTKGKNPAVSAEWLTAGFEILFWTAVLIILIRNQQHRRWKITLPEHPKTGLWLFCIPFVQCMTYGLPEPGAAAVLHLFAAAVGEELVFRSLVPLYLKENTRLSYRNRMLICAGIFALFHLTSLVYADNSGMTIVLVLYAFCAGWGLLSLAEKQNSIIIGTLLHFLINLTASENAQIQKEILLTVLFSGLFLTFGIIYTIKKEKQTHETLH